jgi:XapX domain-containing protein
MKIALGFLLAFAIGIACRLAGLPLPAPPVLIGALLVVAMSTGYVLTDRIAQHRQARHRALCGGPSGERVGQIGSTR